MHLLGMRSSTVIGIICLITLIIHVTVIYLWNLHYVHTRDRCRCDAYSTPNVSPLETMRSINQPIWRPNISKTHNLFHDLEKRKLRHHFEPNADNGHLTVILNVFRGNPKSLRDQLRMLLSQSVKHIHQIWVCTFATDDYNGYTSVLHRVRNEFKGTADVPTIHTVSSTFNFRFHGRFLLAYMAQTEYVLIIDDDIVFNNRLTEELLAAMASQEAVWGVAGHVRDPVPAKADYYSVPKNATKVDYLCGLWFLKRKWLEIFFRERVATWYTGEDMHLSFAAKKYLNLDSLAYRFGVGNGAFKSHRKSYIATSAEIKVRDLRGALFNHLVSRGYVNVRQSPLTTLVFVDSARHANLLMNTLSLCAQNKRPIFGGQGNPAADAPIILHYRWMNTSNAPMERRSNLRALQDLCDKRLGKVALVFTGYNGADMDAIIESARRVCQLTNCSHVMLEKFEENLRSSNSLIWEYVNMRVGYALEEVPMVSLLSDMMPTLVGILKNVKPRHMFLLAPRVCVSGDPLMVARCHQSQLFMLAAQLAIDSLNVGVKIT